ncbi:C-type lectin domain family 2 member F-like isoform X2 [Mesocricetus auratus]|uniref:C-type lectin domain family 2 member F-like isoform X2 n=1 Tax=Mesocricetus auratus TaxID=10036 RepID=A0A3Q0CFA4_MESAU|nr:C-type lectin domain family 2 member F-like isoform X2 [Mesocricetus auratus]
MMIENVYRASHTSHVLGHQRTTFDGKKLLTLWTLLCGGVVVLLWGFFSFPRKFGASRVVRNKTCDDETNICTNSWLKINQNCFFLFQHKNAWLSAQENCQRYEANLAKFTTKTELETLMSHVQALRSSFWIGLNRRNLRTYWVWTDESVYNNLKKVQDHGDCAFMHKNGIDSTNCDDLRDYICSKVGQCP